MQELLDAYTKVKLLKDGEKYKCEPCKKKVLATTKQSFYRCPSILVIQVKRFTNEGKHGGLNAFAKVQNLGLWPLVPDCLT